MDDDDDDGRWGVVGPYMNHYQLKFLVLICGVFVVEWDVVVMEVVVVGGDGCAYMRTTMRMTSGDDYDDDGDDLNWENDDYNHYLQLNQLKPSLPILQLPILDPS